MVFLKEFCIKIFRSVTEFCFDLLQEAMVGI